VDRRLSSKGEQIVRASEQSSTGGVGVTEVAGLFERIKWAPVENRDRHDLGTDLLVAARDPRRFDVGLLIGVQVKGGPAYFKEPEVDASGRVTGWWHRNDSEHIDYWVKHELPHLVVLYDIDERVGYWVHVVPERCVSTGKGLKILVPKENTVSEADVPKLLNVALQQRGSISLEGTSFDAAAVHVAPGDRLRYALLIPRLVAPHANQHSHGTLEPEEAVALLTLLHPQRLTARLKDKQIWDDLNQPPQRDDWRWHFAYGLWLYIAFNETTALEASYVAVTNKAERSDWRVAAAAVMASARIELGELDEATFLIDKELERDVAAPVDQGWLLVHAANCAAIAGRVDVAKELAAKALDQLKLKADDATVSLLTGVAYRIIFTLTSWLDVDRYVSDTLRAGDNAGSWWRDQQLRWALDAVALERFREWSQESTSRWEAEPPGQQLRPSTLMALFTGDHAGWSAAESRLGRYEMQRATTPDEYLSAFVRLVRSGDKESVLLAGRRVRHVGPTSALRRLSVMCTPRFIGTTRVDLMLGFWGEFGDLAEELAADELVIWCIQQATLPPLMAGHRDVSLQDLLEAVLVALPATTAAVRDVVVQNLKSISIEWTDITSFTRLSQVLEQQAPGKLDSSFLFKVAQQHSKRPEVSGLVAVAARVGSADAKALLLEAALKGDFVAAQNALYSRWLDEEGAIHVTETIATALDKERSDSKNGTIGSGYAVDRALLLVHIIVEFPRIAAWQTVADYLGDAHVVADHKRGAVLYLGRQKNRIGAPALKVLHATLPGLAASKYLPRNLLNFNSPRKLATDLSDYLAWTLGLSGTSTLEGFVCSAFANGGLHKRWAWDVLSSVLPEEYDLVALQGLTDDDLGVRARCAQFLARRINAGEDSETLRQAAQIVLSDTGTLLPRSFLGEISANSAPSVKTLVGALKSNVSAEIRTQVRDILET
jgi:hypothetical protein